jgi:F-box and leucine-rich repeat protein 4
MFFKIVLEFSTAYGSSSSISYSAVNILGRPSKFPSYGDFAECYSLRKYGKPEEAEFSIVHSNYIPFHDFISIKYEHFVIPKEIKIFETYNPGKLSEK